MNSDAAGARSALLDDYLPEFADATARAIFGDGFADGAVTSRGPRGWIVSAEGEVHRPSALPAYNEDLDDEDKARIVLEAIRQHLRCGATLPTVRFFDPGTAHHAHRCLGRIGRPDLIHLHAYSAMAGYYRDCLPPILRWLDSGEVESLPGNCFDRFEVLATMQDCSDIVVPLLERLLRGGAKALAFDIPSSLVSIMEYHRVPRPLFRRVWEEVMVPSFAEFFSPRADLFAVLLASRYLQDATLGDAIASENPIEPRAWSAIVASFIEEPAQLPRSSAG